MASHLYNEVLTTNVRIYSQYAKEYEERTKSGHTNYLKTFIDLFVSRLEGKTVLDIGCGPGRDLAYFRDRNLSARGIDSSSVMCASAKGRGLDVETNDFFGFVCEDNSVDGIWAYTSHTVIPKDDFRQLLIKYKKILKEGAGILALGMIEGTYEGWKADDKYDGSRRFVARYLPNELEMILSEVFGSVWVDRIELAEKVYLHCICKNIEPASSDDAKAAAKNLFDKYSATYDQRTRSGIELLREDRAFFFNAVNSLGIGKPRILDLGCGPGRDMRIFKEMGADVTGIDISGSNVLNCVSAGLDSHIGDFYEIDSMFHDDLYDGIWCNCSITNWVIKADLNLILQKVRTLIKPDGVIFVGSVLGSFCGWERDNKYGGLKRYNIHWQECELKDRLSVLGRIVYERRLTNTGNKDYLNLGYSNG